MSRIVMQVKVKPRSRESKLVQEADGTWTARIKSPPVDGKANDELIALVAAHHGRPRSAVTIRSGASARLKLVAVELP
jgi:uncharacterized protein (TIGR00251 family)